MIFHLPQDDVIACESLLPLDELSNATIPVLFATPTDNGRKGDAGGHRISHFKPLYVSVDEERFGAAPTAVGGGLTEHERQLLLDYKVRFKNGRLLVQNESELDQNIQNPWLLLN